MAPSVKALTQFPTVLDKMAQSLAGITTFIINQSGALFQKNQIGKTTTEIATATTEFNPDKTWVPTPE